MTKNLDDSHEVLSGDKKRNFSNGSIYDLDNLSRLNIYPEKWGRRTSSTSAYDLSYLGAGLSGKKYKK